VIDEYNKKMLLSSLDKIVGTRGRLEVVEVELKQGDKTSKQTSNAI